MAPVLDISVAIGSVVGSLTTATTSAPTVTPYAPVGAGVQSAPSLFTTATTDITSHGPYEGTPTTTGAEQAYATLSATISPLPKTATYYNDNGKLQQPEVIPYQPFGGKGYDQVPVYQVESDHDFESLALGIHQELIELDLFHYGLALFNESEFEEAGLTKSDRDLLQYMAVQETGHATLVANMLGWDAAPRQCTYDYPFKTVREYIDFMQKRTRWGESGNWGFIGHLDSREVATLLVQAEAIEARQQSVFRQMLGLHPMPIWFAPGIPQSWHWTLLAQYISSCPENNTRVAWQNFPALHVADQPNPNRINANNTQPWELVGNRTGDPSDSTVVPDDDNCLETDETGSSCIAAISQDRYIPLSYPGKVINLTWDAPGAAVGPNNSYVTSTTAGEPAYVAWLGQYNLTYTPLTKTSNNSGSTYQPAGDVFQGDPALNGTAFIALTDTDELFLTPFNLSLINPHVAALGLYQAG
ncbi:hypothetical protein PRZ48_000791 [Zasmidium cellare]|uniref:Protein rds1 n=1 Tax=Zasmidium cellare TaxID=395010 RepID=A0ABR0EZH6_ZASCE|nr:hypothetical protein PRZ48_000791 [Zasmidium cellare]